MALLVLRAREEHWKAVLRLAYQDVILNALLIYDWRKLRGTGACDFYVALSSKKGVEAACVVFHDRDFDSVLFCGSRSGVKAILTEVRPSRAVMPVVRPEELDVVLEALGGRAGPIYDALLMKCTKNSFKPLIKQDVIRLGLEHAEIFRFFMAEREVQPVVMTPREALERLSDEERPVFAVIEDGRIASVATISFSMPEVSMVGVVYTAPELRNRGLATSVVSVATSEALRRSKVAALIVGADNAPAIRVYEKVGYVTHRCLKWICVELDYPP